MESAVRHSKGIDLSHPGVRKFYVHDGKSLNALKDMPQWEVLGGQCRKCAHIGWLDKRAVLQLHGNLYLIHVRQKLRCIPCHYRGENDVLIGMMERNV
jgi:hypothetical protein